MYFLATFPQFTSPAQTPFSFVLTLLNDLLFFKEAYKLSSLTVSLGFSLLSMKLPCHVRILVSNKMCMLFLLLAVFCQFNSQSPVTELKRAEEKSLLSDRGQCPVRNKRQRRRRGKRGACTPDDITDAPG